MRPHGSRRRARARLLTMAIIRDLAGSLSSWHATLRQGGALLRAILVGAIIGSYWIGGKHCTGECIMTRQAISISRSPNYQFVDEPSSVQVSRLNPILVGDFTQEKSF